MKRRVLFALAFLAVSTGSVAQSPPAPPSPAPNMEPLTLKKRVVAGQPEKFDYWYSTNPDCTAVGYPEVRVVTAPTHGTMTVQKGQEFPSFPDSNVRKACNKQRVPVTLAYYEAPPGFGGSDTLAVEIRFPNGRSRVVTYDIKVWPSPPEKIAGGNPRYPPEALRQGIEGLVVALVYVDSAGNVTTVVIKESPHDLLSAEAIAAMQQWRFRAPIEDGLPAAYVGRYEVLFRVGNAAPSIERSSQSP